MKLYLWVDPYKIKYGSSMVFAIAETENDARKQAAIGRSYSYGEFEKDGDYSKLAAELGKPDRVVDLPCAEWHEWSE